jgi:hypothetical protein
MAIAEQQEIERGPEPKQTSRLPTPAWPKPSQLRRSVPIYRLFAELWAIPEVSQIGLLLDDEGVKVRVLISDDTTAVRSKVYAAERAYLNSTPPHGFKLWASALSKVGNVMPPPFDPVLER